MEFDLSWILLGLPLAFGLGWLASRMDLRQLRLENRQTPKAYFKGLNHLLNEQQDQAIVIIRNGLVNHNAVADVEINLSATLIELGQIQ